MKLVENREEQFKASGTYVIQDKIYNGYPLWKHESKNRYIWFDKQLSRWLVGETDGKGGKKKLFTGPWSDDRYPTVQESWGNGQILFTSA